MGYTSTDFRYKPTLEEIKDVFLKLRVDLSSSTVKILLYNNIAKKLGMDLDFYYLDKPETRFYYSKYSKIKLLFIPKHY